MGAELPAETASRGYWGSDVGVRGIFGVDLREGGVFLLYLCGNLVGVDEFMYEDY